MPRTSAATLATSMHRSAQTPPRLYVRFSPSYIQIDALLLAGVLQIECCICCLFAVYPLTSQIAQVLHPSADNSGAQAWA